MICIPLRGICNSITCLKAMKGDKIALETIIKCIWKRGKIIITVLLFGNVAIEKEPVIID